MDDIVLNLFYIKTVGVVKLHTKHCRNHTFVTVTSAILPNVRSSGPGVVQPK